MIEVLKNFVEGLWWLLYAIGLIAAIAAVVLFVKSILIKVYESPDPFDFFEFKNEVCDHPVFKSTAEEIPAWGWKCPDCKKRIYEKN